MNNLTPNTFPSNFKPLTFINKDEDTIMAKTPFFIYEIWRLKSGYKPVLVFNPQLSDIRGIITDFSFKLGQSLDIEKAEEVCQMHYLEHLNAMINEAQTKFNAEADEEDYNGCKRCDSLEDNPNPCCDMGRCEAPKGTSDVTNCIHCGGELIEKDGAWYHHSQFDCDELGDPQDYVSK